MISALVLGAILTQAGPATRIAVLLDDSAPGAPARACIESALMAQGFEVVAEDVSEKIRKVVAPKAVLENRLPQGPSVFEADAVLGGEASYGTPTEVEGVKSIPATLTARLIDIGTGHTTATIQTTGVGLGVEGPALFQRAAKQAVDHLFADARLKDALKSVGQEAGMVTLIVQGVPSREALLTLRRGLERALAGAPAKEIYFAKGLGELRLGGSKAKSMVGPDIADVIGETKSLAITVEEVANTRIVATYTPARAVSISALVTEPKVPASMKKAAAEELGRYVANRIATFEYAKASYQPGKLTREQALKRAKELNADVLVESELLGSAGSSALAIRIIDARTKKPILREQRLLEKDGGLATAEGMLLTIKTELPERLSAAPPDPARPASPGDPLPTATNEKKPAE
jgi:hypothetical protein